jgi:uncharacterized membrane protein
MSTDSVAAAGRPGVDWRRAEFVLTLLAFIGFIALPIRITTIYSGLPAHPLFVHLPVVLIPTTIVAAIVFAFKREWFTRYGIALALASIVAMSSTFLAMQAGAALRRELNLQGQAAQLISEHSQAAHILAIVYVLFTATLIVTFAANRISSGMPTGLAIVDGLLAAKSVYTALLRAARAAVHRRRLHDLPHRRPRRESGMAGSTAGLTPRISRRPRRSGRRTGALLAAEPRHPVAP